MRGRRRLAPLASLALLFLCLLPVDTSCTAKPNCPMGQKAQRAQSHQGHMWNCVPQD